MKFLTLPLLEAIPSLVHAVFNRHGGVSLPPFDTNNLSFGVEDDAAHVHSNRQQVKNILNINTLVSSKQVHGDRCFIVSADLSQDIECEGYDALITNRPGIGLMIQQADCQAVMLFDGVKKVVANIHAGWRGSKSNIIARTINQMKRHFGTRPEDLYAGISPSLGPCCAEFVNHRKELGGEFSLYQTKQNHFDFWSVSRNQLSEAGVQPENIQAAEVCTVCDRDYFSYRRTKITGRFASVIALSEAK